MKAHDPIIAVRRQPNDWRIAKYYKSQIENIHWDIVSGGVKSRSPQYFPYGYVWCNDQIEGEVAHSGVHGPCPHRIKICIVKKDNDPSVIKQLVKQIGPRPKTRQPDPRRKHWCITDITDILEGKTKPMSSGELISELINRGHSASAMRAAIKKHSDLFEITRWEEDKRQKAYKLKQHPNTAADTRVES